MYSLLSHVQPTLGVSGRKSPLTLTAYGVPRGEGKEDVALCIAFNLD
jgi:hypothetical protein